MRKLILVFLLILTVIAVGQDRDVDPAGRNFLFTETGKAAKLKANGLVNGQGVAFVDVNNDGMLDIFITNAAEPVNNKNHNLLFINKGNGTFKEEAATAGLEGASDLGPAGAVFIDIDMDGDLDLLLSNSGSVQPGQNRLYINDGSGIFVDSTKNIRLEGKFYRSLGVTAGDFSGDGRPDAIFTNPVTDISDVPPQQRNLTRFFKGKRNGNLRFGTSKAGLFYTGITYGITAGDLDGDGDLDVIESKNPEFNFGYVTNTLFRNDGSGNFTDDSYLLGTTFSNDGMTTYYGSALGDLDNDGDLDLLTISKSQIRVFSNDGDAIFTDISDSTDISGGGYTAAIGDLNNDGKQDIIIADLVDGVTFFENLGQFRFRKVNPTGYQAPSASEPRGMALGDYDNDGDLDIVVVHQDRYIQLIRNDADNSNYLKFELTSPDGEKGAVGTKVFVYQSGKDFAADSLMAFREVASSTGYLSQNSPVLHFGLKRKKKRVDVIIELTDGSMIKFLKVLPGRTIKVDF